MENLWFEDEDVATFEGHLTSFHSDCLGGSDTQFWGGTLSTPIPCCSSFTHHQKGAVCSLRTLRCRPEKGIYRKPWLIIQLGNLSFSCVFTQKSVSWFPQLLKCLLQMNAIWIKWDNKRRAHSIGPGMKQAYNKASAFAFLPSLFIQRLWPEVRNQLFSSCPILSSLGALPEK